MPQSVINKRRDITKGGFSHRWWDLVGRCGWGCLYSRSGDSGDTAPCGAERQERVPRRPQGQTSAAASLACLSCKLQYSTVPTLGGHPQVDILPAPTSEEQGASGVVDRHPARERRRGGLLTFRHFKQIVLERPDLRPVSNLFLARLAFRQQFTLPFSPASAVAHFHPPCSDRLKTISSAAPVRIPTPVLRPDSHPAPPSAPIRPAPLPAPPLLFSFSLNDTSMLPAHASAYSARLPTPHSRVSRRAISFLSATLH